MEQQESKTYIKAKDLASQGIIVAVRNPEDIFKHSYYVPNVVKSATSWVCAFPEIEGYEGRVVDVALSPYEEGNFEVRVTAWEDGKKVVKKDWHMRSFNDEQFVYADDSLSGKRLVNSCKNSKHVQEAHLCSSNVKSKFHITGEIPVFTGEPVVLLMKNNDVKRVDNFIVTGVNTTSMKTILDEATSIYEKVGKYPPIMYVEFYEGLYNGKPAVFSKVVHSIEVGDTIQKPSEIAMNNWKKNQAKYMALEPKLTSQEIDEIAAVIDF